MSTKHENPYGGNYGEIFGYIQKKQIVTKIEVIEFCKTLNMSLKAAKSSVVVIMSPRESSKRGDCRGNYSAKGEFYFLKRLASKENEPKRYRLFWRKEVLPHRSRKEKEVKLQKTSKVTIQEVVT